jgi:RNA polymerase sigma-70 factor (ECF subfamily)
MASTVTKPLHPIETIRPMSIDPPAEVLRLFGEYGSSLYRFCRAALGSGDDAEDIVQDTFLKLLQHLRADGNRANLRAWLFTVAANECRDRTRWRLRWLPWREDRDDRPDTKIAEPPDQPPDLRRARAAMRALAPRDRLLLSLRAQGLSYREISAAAEIREQSVGRLLARAVDRWKRGVEGMAKPLQR